MKFCMECKEDTPCSIPNTEHEVAVDICSICGNTKQVRICVHLEVTH